MPMASQEISWVSKSGVADAGAGSLVYSEPRADWTRSTKEETRSLARSVHPARATAMSKAAHVVCFMEDSETDIGGQRSPADPTHYGRWESGNRRTMEVASVDPIHQGGLLDQGGQPSAMTPIIPRSTSSATTKPTAAPILVPPCRASSMRACSGAWDARIWSTR